MSSERLRFSDKTNQNSSIQNTQFSAISHATCHQPNPRWSEIAFLTLPAPAPQSSFIMTPAWLKQIDK